MPYLDEIMKMAHACGFKISLITNASLFSKNMIYTIVPIMCLLGVSVDSVNHITHQKIGRCDHYNTPDMDIIKSHIQTFKDINLA